MILNFGSINIDYVYRVLNLPKPGETVSAISFEKFLGGKGINQSVGILQAGGIVRHIGGVGSDDAWVLEQIKKLGIARNSIFTKEEPTGHAVIYVDTAAENQIVIYGGANQSLTKEVIEAEIKKLMPNQWILMQNETNATFDIALSAKKNGHRLAYSAAPFDANSALKILKYVDLLVVNETEAEELTILGGKPINALGIEMVLVTRGVKGASMWINNEEITQDAFPVKSVDTTGAGDTFLGYFLAKYDETNDPRLALRYGAAASAIQVTKRGSAVAIPCMGDVINFLKDK